MKAIFLKELREHAIWAALALLAVSILLAAVTYDGQHGTSDLKLILINSRMTMATGSAFPTIGFSFGLLMILRDYRIGRWAFLTHRPITRTRIFLGKFLAGALLYLLATAPPLAVTAWWVAAPGHVAAPFDWHMLLPSLVDLASGIMYLSAGMLVAARKARWFGSRLFPIALALIVSLFALIKTGDFQQEFGMLFLGFLLLFAAAWGAFVAAGECETLPWPIQLLTTIIVTVGAYAVIILAFGLVSSISEPVCK